MMLELCSNNKFIEIKFPILKEGISNFITHKYIKKEIDYKSQK